MKVVQILRDPFARATLLRRTLNVQERPASCCNCGSDHARFRYTWESDSIRRADTCWSRPMCSIECFRAYCAC